MTTDATTFTPIADPETGELLAESEDERRELIDLAGRQLVDAALAAKVAARARRVLGLLMAEGDAWADPERSGWAVTVKPAASPRRVVVEHAVMEHREALAPLGLGPHEETRTVVVLPRVGDLTSVGARAALARVGLTPEQLVHTPERGAPQVVVIEPEVAG